MNLMQQLEAYHNNIPQVPAATVKLWKDDSHEEKAEAFKKIMTVPMSVKQIAAAIGYKTEESARKALKKLIEVGYPIQKISTDLNHNNAKLYRWVNELRSDAS